MPTAIKNHRYPKNKLPVVNLKPRRSAHQRGYTYRWQQARLAYLRDHPLCVQCEASGIIRSATVVDHIQAHKNDRTLFWDRNNWQALCASCHSRKTAQQDGGYGNPSS